MSIKKIFLYTLSLLCCFSAALLFCSCKPSTEASANTLRPTAEPTPTPVPRDTENDTKLSASMVYANNAANKVQGYYDTAARNKYIIDNKNSKTIINLSGDNLGLQSLGTLNGAVFIEGGMTGYVITSDGTKYTVANSNSSGRINANRIGYYYYEVNLRDLSFTNKISDDSQITKASDITNYNAGSLYGNMISDIAVNNKVISAKITGTSDPYLVMPVSANLDGCNMVKLEMSVKGSASSGSLYYFTTLQSGFTGDQRIPFQVIADGEYHTYYIDLSGAVDTSSTMNSLRFDVEGATIGDTFSIKSVSFIKTNGSLNIPCGYEQTIHAYPDKYHNELRIIFDEQTDGYTQFGYEYKIPVEKVASIQFETSGGTFTDITEFDGTSLSYIGFDIKDTGIIGFIIPSDGLTSCEIEQNDGYYIFRNCIDISGKHRAKSSVNFGHRIYYGESHSFDDIAKEAYIERNPLTATVTDKVTAKSRLKFIGYDKIIGAYKFTLTGTDFSTAYLEKNHNYYYGGTITFSGDDKYDRNIYVWGNGAAGCLEGAVILDDKKILTPIQVEVCKNFAGEREEPYYDPSDSEYGDSIYPLVVKKNEQLTHTLLNLYQNWGTNAIKQISSISFHISYYHLSTGVTESNCIAPYFVYGRDGWTLPDFRGASGIMWSNQPQFNSVGRLRFLSYVNSDGATVRSEYTGSNIISSGTSYADIEYSYRSDCNSMEYTLRHVEFPQNDENRTYYTMDLVFHRDIDIADVRNNFTLFDFDGRFQAFKTTSYKSANGSIVDVTNNISKVSAPQLYTLSKDSPFFSYYNYDPDSSANKNDVMNFAMLIRDYSVTIEGKAWEGNLILRNSLFLNGSNMLNLAALSLDLGDTSFKSGDRITMSFILLPYGVKNMTDDPNVHYVYEDSIENPWRIKSAEIGTIVEDEYLAEINCTDNTAQFTVTGGRNACVVRVNGFTKLVRPKLQELVNNEWVDITYSVEEYDGYQVNYTFDGNYSYSFVINMEKPSDERTFRVTSE